MTHVGHGGGGGHGGGHGHGGGFQGVYYDPWVFYGLGDDEACSDAHKKHVAGAGELSTGTGGLLVLAVLWWLVSEADKRVPR